MVEAYQKIRIQILLNVVVCFILFYCNYNLNQLWEPWYAMIQHPHHHDWSTILKHRSNRTSHLTQWSLPHHLGPPRCTQMYPAAEPVFHDLLPQAQRLDPVAWSRLGMVGDWLVSGWWVVEWLWLVIWYFIYHSYTIECTIEDTIEHHDLNSLWIPWYPNSHAMLNPKLRNALAERTPRVAALPPRGARFQRGCKSLLPWRSWPSPAFTELWIGCADYAGGCGSTLTIHFKGDDNHPWGLKELLVALDALSWILPPSSSWRTGSQFTRFTISSEHMNRC